MKIKAVEKISRWCLIFMPILLFAQNQFVITIPSEQVFFLYQNYPNPFNSRTTFSFAVDDRSEVELFICDITGKKTASLIKKVYQPGYHQETVDLSNLASGSYFYNIKAFNYRTRTIKMLSKKMIIIK